MNWKNIIGLTLLYIFISYLYPIQGYEFLDANTRCNKATGQIQYKSQSGWTYR